MSYNYRLCNNLAAKPNIAPENLRPNNNISTVHVVNKVNTVVTFVVMEVKTSTKLASKAVI
jgi:hypothetical protein